MLKAVVKGIGSYVPEGILTNLDLEKAVETSDEWIKQRTGISERRIALAEEATSDLAAKAGLAAIKNSGLSKEQIDCVIVATSTPDHILPPVACLVQNKLKLGKVAGFDVAATCTGFISALSIAEQFIKAAKYKNVLVIGAETLSRLVNWQDRTTCILFGDGAGAFVLSRGDDTDTSKGIIYSATQIDGQYFEDLIVPAGGVKEPVTEEGLRKGRNKIHMAGNKIFKLAVTAMASIAKDSLEQAKLAIDDIDWVVPHQANRRIIEAVAKGLGITMKKVVDNIEYYGNSSTATIPLALDLNLKQGRIKKGDKILFVAFGGGLTWGSLILQL